MRNRLRGREARSTYHDFDLASLPARYNPPKSGRLLAPRPVNSFLRSARILQNGQLIAHTTSTVAGIAASPFCPEAVRRLQQFKHRQGPFVLIADSTHTAIHHTRYLSPTLRQAMRQLWPGKTTLIVPGKPGLPRACYAKGCIALRVDADHVSRRLAKLCGGLMISSSLNQHKQPVQTPSRHLRMRWHRHIHAAIAAGGKGSAPSTLLLWKRGCFRILRG